QAASVKGRLVLSRALKEEEVRKLPVVREQEDALAWLEGRLEVDFDLSPELMRVSMTGEDPDALKTLVNAVVQAYVREAVSREQKQRAERVEELKRVQGELDVLLKEKKATLRTLARDFGGVDAKLRVLYQGMALKRLALIEAEMVALHRELTRAKVEAEFDRD